MDVIQARKDFPILDSELDGKKLVYLDSAATSQKPVQVIEAMKNFMLDSNGTVRRGVYDLSVKSTQAFDEVRSGVKDFINARNNEEIIFVRGATEAINLVASSFCGWKKDQSYEILISGLEHHANIVPWQINAEKFGATIKVIPVLDDGSLDQEAFEQLISSGNVKMLALGHISNALGTINPIKAMIEKAHANGALVLIDGAQGITHAQVDVQDLDCDFYCFSGHKLYAPTGVGVLYGKKEILNEMPPYHGGGEMIDKVSFEKTTYAELPFKFEAGTPAIIEVIGLGEAIKYLKNIGMQNILEREDLLLKYALKKVPSIDGIKVLGPSFDKKRASIISFIFDDIEAFDIGTMMNEHGIAIRTGHHCAQPLMQRFNTSGTSRISMAFYNNEDDIDRCFEALEKVINLFR